MTTDDLHPFDVTGPLPDGRVALEASAGTGKTWTIAALVVRYVAEGVADIEQLLVVTFTRAATAELRDRIRSRLVSTLAVLDGHANRDGDPVAALLADGPVEEVALRRRRLATALAGFDAATITTIHGFCHQVLATTGHVGDVDGHGQLVDQVDDLVRAATRDLLVRHFGGAAADVQADRPTVARAEKVAEVALREITATIAPDPDDVGGAGQAHALARLAIDVRDEVDRRKRVKGLLTFDDLLTRLAASLEDQDVSPAVLEALRARYRVALIDEFQDTDPVQWAILGRVFADRTLVLIGDPKQAIYRFRGADVHAYLQATQAPGTARATLGTNHRSDARLVDAVNALFAGTAFGSEAIPHRQVRARHLADRLTFPDARPRPVLRLRVLPEAMGADAARDRIARDLAAEVTRLLDQRPSLPGDHVLRPGDCAVLVRSNVQAADVKRALADVGVHAVINGVGSVLETPAAADWVRMLEALERPSSPTRVRALALSPLVGASPAEVAQADDLAEASRHDQAHRWARVLGDHGIATLVRTVQRETGMVAQLLGQEGGERYLTDFEHVAELLHAVAASERLGPSALLSWLVDQQQRVDELPQDQRARRLESDARAVQVLTIHRAKGLQFPVVFCPYLMSTGMRPQVPVVYRGAADRTVVDVGGPDLRAAKAQARREDLGEQLRLLYVAATRAEHRLVLWWFPFNATGKGRPGYVESALSKTLFCPAPTEGARVAADVDAPALDLQALPAALDTAVGRLGDGADWQPVPDQPVPVAWVDDTTVAGDPRRRVFTGEVDRSWTRASYTALTRPVPRRAVEGTPDTLPVRDDEADLEAGPPGPDELGDHVALPLGDQPAGAVFGTVVHAVVEHVDLDAPALDTAVAHEVQRQVRRGGIELPDPPGLSAGLLTALRTPLGAPFGDVTLAGLERGDRLDELEFELPLAHGDAHVTLDAVGRLLTDHLPTDDPFAGYPPRLSDRDLARRVRGYLTGSIDLVLRRRTPDGPRFHVIDHKTNRLYAPDEVGSTWHYRPEALVEAMQHSHYPLQALLYQVALHRYLRWRLAGYDPDTHLGHVGYLFLRGMVGPTAPRRDDVPCGVMAWRPPTALVVALSDLLAVGLGRAA